MVEGTLRERECEPENVQVVVEERRQVVTELTVTMMDETGVLKTITKTETETTPTTCNCHCTEELENLRGQRDHLENIAELLTTRLTQLGLQLEDEQAKNRRAWRENCERVQALDAELAEREAELAARDANPQQYPPTLAHIMICMCPHALPLHLSLLVYPGLLFPLFQI